MPVPSVPILFMFGLLTDSYPKGDHTFYHNTLELCHESTDKNIPQTQRGPTIRKIFSAVCSGWEDQGRREG